VELAGFVSEAQGHLSALIHPFGNCEARQIKSGTFSLRHIDFTLPEAFSPLLNMLQDWSLRSKCRFLEPEGFAQVGNQFSSRLVVIPGIGDTPWKATLSPKLTDVDNPDTTPKLDYFRVEGHPSPNL
jgi:hypothetical protein